MAVAAVVFMAVSWDRLDARAQGLVLVGLTAVAAGTTGVLARRRLPATAEAVGLVTVVLALADAHALRIGVAPDASAATWWAGSLAAVSLGGWWLGRATQVRSTRVVAAVLGQLSLPVLLYPTDLSPSAAAALLLGQVALVLLLLDRTPRAIGAARAAATSVAIAQWGTVAFVSLAVLPVSDAGELRSSATVLALCAGVAALAAVLRRAVDADRSVALATATSLGFVASTVALGTLLAGALLAPACLALAAVVVGAGVRVPRRWGAVPTTIASVVAGLASLPLAAASAAVVAGGIDVAAVPWQDSATAEAGSFVVGVDAVSPLALVLHLGLLVVLALAAAPAVGRRSVGIAVVGVAVAGVVVAPVLVPLSTGGAAVVSLLGASGGAWLAVRARDRAMVRNAGLLAATGLAGVGALWSAAAPEPSLLAAGGITAIALVAVVVARRDGSLGPATVAGAVTVLAASAGVGVAGSIAGAGGGASLAAGSVAELLLGLVAAQALDPGGRRQDLDGVLARTAEVVAGGVHLWVLLVLVGSGDQRATSVVLASGTLVAALHAARPGRRGLAVVAVVEGLALTWWQLSLAGVTVLEAYTGPAALVLLALGIRAELRVERGSARPAGPATGATGPTDLGHHGPVDGSTADAGSWATVGPGLVLALAPTVLVGLGDPGLVRPLGGLVAGAVVLVLGAVTRRRAAVDVGLAVVVLLGLGQLAPVVGSLPNWVTLGATGLALVAVGATFEQRRRDLDEVKDRYASLR